jgi:hypothetical protein
MWVKQLDQLSGLPSDLQWAILWALQLVRQLDQLLELMSGF